MKFSSRGQSFLLTFLLVSVFLLALTPITTFDFWIHLATGRYLVQEGIIPRVNTFSYSFPEYPWNYVIGPFQLVLYLVYLLAGFNGIIVYKALLLGLTFYFLWRISEENDSPPLFKFLLLFLAAVVMRERFSVRPQLWFFLLTAYYLFALRRFQKSRERKYLWSLLPLQMLWVNAHGSFLIGLYLVGLLAVLMSVKSLFDQYMPRQSFLIEDLKCPARPVWFTLLGLIAVSLMNSHGYRVFLQPFEIGSQQVALLSVAERQAVDIGRWLGPYGALAALGVLAIISGLLSREWYFVLLLATFLPMSFRAIRFIGIFGVIASAAVPGLLSGGIFKKLNKIFNNLIVLILSVIVVLITTGYLCLNPLDEPFGFGLNKLTTPVKAADFLIDNQIDGPLYNDIDLGDYLIWRLYPKEKVLIDGRRFAAYPRDFYEKIEFLHSPGPAWNALMNKYRFNTAILSYSPINVENLFPSSQWALVFWDDVAMVFIRRTPANQAVIKKNEFKYFMPNRFSDLRTQSPYLRKKLLFDLRTSRDIHPDSYRVNFALGYLYSWQGADKLGLAEEYLKKTIRLSPLFAPAYAQLGLIYRNSGRYENAIYYLKRCIRIAPQFKIAYFYLSSTYGILKDQKRAAEYLKIYNGI